MAPITNVKVLDVFEMKGKRDKLIQSKIFHQDLPFLLLCTQSNQPNYVTLMVEDHGQMLTTVNLIFCTLSGDVIDERDMRYPKMKSNKQPTRVTIVAEETVRNGSVTTYTIELKASVLKERNFNLQHPLKFVLQGIYSENSVIGSQRPYFVCALPPAVIYAQASCFYRDKGFAEGACAVLAREVPVTDLLDTSFRASIKAIPVGEFLWLVDIFISTTSGLPKWVFSESVESRNWLLQEVFAAHQYSYSSAEQPEKQLCVDYKTVVQMFTGQTSSVKASAKERGYCKLRLIASTAAKFSQHVLAGDIIGILSQARAKRVLSKWPARSYLLRISSSDPGNLIMSYVTAARQVHSLILKVADDDELDRYIRRFPDIDVEKLQYASYRKMYQAPELINLNKMSAPYICRETDVSPSAGPIPMAPPVLNTAAAMDTLMQELDMELDMEELTSDAEACPISPPATHAPPAAGAVFPAPAGFVRLSVTYGNQREVVEMGSSITYEKLLEQVKLYWCIAPIPAVTLVDERQRALTGQIRADITSVFVVPIASAWS
mmetsp:Transcript_2116/g.7676  ORF Transcript_2116/g.7676 Transcript_2116/m.7676 type:complete len:547 (+) Transcript_2116:280-1920(+)|eukprot:CAMPEP_0114616744 /NCGR_PEP_ID=MMETSP0168-20121206/6844_1 /TAXON_ID=95228 ORGANISM="Vannella sp., Strain DIVA3 517/6/12" /NCGR_SAMPLE_ID=MMETSP0168 /ASSEMBLY_ACC=CAM_ASM_000044 /LENGTH=546 /DNA_ID=CAMNT_0001827867 /DNA_START=261 /DNA_END=1901 /DNA_ORIENTATION=-